MKKKKCQWLRWTLLVLSALLFIWMFLPLFSGVLNSVNAGAMVASLLVILVCCFWPRVKRLLQRLWSKKTWRSVLILLSMLLSAGFLALFTATGFILAGMTCSAGRCDTLIVLGCQVRGQTPSQLLRFRIDAAYDYLTAYPQTVCIVSGGKGNDEGVSEAVCMYRELCKRGIDASRIYIEDTSTSTIENLEYSKALIAREGLSENVAIVTNTFHMCRARYVAANCGLPAQGVCARTTPQLFAVYVVREAVAILWYCVFGLK